MVVTQNLRIEADAGIDDSLVGPVEEIIETVSAYKDAGGTHLNVRLRDMATDECVDQLEFFAERIRPSV